MNILIVGRQTSICLSADSFKKLKGADQYLISTHLTHDYPSEKLRNPYITREITFL